MKLTIFRKTSDSDAVPIAVLSRETATYTVCDQQSVKFTVKRSGDTVTVSEPPTRKPTVMLSLAPKEAYPISKGQIYRIGNIALAINNISETRMEVLPIDADGERKHPAHIFLPCVDAISVGSSSSQTLQLRAAGVSRSHAVIRSRDKRWVIEDSGSRNGTWLYCHTLQSVRRNSGEVVVRPGQLVKRIREDFTFTFSQ